MCLDVEDPVKQCHKRQKMNMGVRSRIMEVKDELYNIRLAFMWKKQQEWKVTNEAFLPYSLCFTTMTTFLS
jgi:hypothetical protein